MVKDSVTAMFEWSETAVEFTIYIRACLGEALLAFCIERDPLNLTLAYTQTMSFLHLVDDHLVV